MDHIFPWTTVLTVVFFMCWELYLLENKIQLWEIFTILKVTYVSLPTDGTNMSELIIS
ncbi:hypothetical protein ACIQZG_07950 [Lysinibacillus sp. NPDC096418]|uniref:hypothetical protein n=1 Tax=Lysinibacillus sp. NPDC096418 TaxID=3364138 RepID=UPI0038066284